MNLCNQSLIERLCKTVGQKIIKDIIDFGTGFKNKLTNIFKRKKISKRVFLQKLIIKSEKENNKYQKPWGPSFSVKKMP